MYRRRRQRLLLGVVLILLLAYTAGQLLNGTGHGRVSTVRTRIDQPRTFLSAVSWPQRGQAALVLGDGHPVASPGEQPAPIASLAKVMTAFLVLKRYPLSGAEDGFTLTVSAGEAEGVAQDRAEGQSVVAVAAGEQLTERQLLEALLVPSGNNIARMLGEVVGGSGFVEQMNGEARALGMDHTTYTDPSGWDPDTVSTAADQLRLFQQAMRFPLFREIVSMPSVTLPVAGTLTNFNPLIADGYAGKTGSDSAAGGCLAFFTQVTFAGREVTAIGVVMGQGQGSNTRALLAAAGLAAQQLVGSVAPVTSGRTSPAPGAGTGERDAGHRGRVPPQEPTSTQTRSRSTHDQKTTCLVRVAPSDGGRAAPCLWLAGGTVIARDAAVGWAGTAAGANPQPTFMEQT